MTHQGRAAQCSSWYGKDVECPKRAYCHAFVATELLQYCLHVIQCVGLAPILLMMLLIDWMREWEACFICDRESVIKSCGGKNEIDTN